MGFYLAFEPDLGTPVYKSGQSYVGSSQVSVAVCGISAAGFGAVDMLATAIGEESYYRGILYEEAKRALGFWPARALDMIFFSGSASAVGYKIRIEDGNNSIQLRLAFRNDFGVRPGQRPGGSASGGRSAFLE